MASTSTSRSSKISRPNAQFAQPIETFKQHYLSALFPKHNGQNSTQDNYTTYTFLSALNSLKRFNLIELILRKDSPDMMSIIEHFSRRRPCILVGKMENLEGALSGETKA